MYKALVILGLVGLSILGGAAVYGLHLWFTRPEFQVPPSYFDIPASPVGMLTLAALGGIFLALGRKQSKQSKGK